MNMIGNQTFEDGLNAMAVVMLGVLTKRGLTDDQAVIIINEGLDTARRQIAGEDAVVLVSD